MSPLPRLALAAALCLCAMCLMARPVLAADKLFVVASFTILADMAAKAGGDRVSVISLAGPGTDAHGFEPKPGDAKAVGQAALVIANGLGFDPWMDKTVKASGGKGVRLTASRGVAARRAEAGDHGHKKGHGPELDPHAWQDARNALVYVDNIAAGLTQADPAGSETYKAGAAAYKKEIEALDAWIRSELAAIPENQRRIVTAHEGMGYFAAAYGLTLSSPAGAGAAAEPTAKDLARLIAQIRKDNIKAVFLENVSDAKLMETLARESGAKIGGKLYTDALTGPDGPAPDYLTMMRANTLTIKKALTD